MEYRCEWCGKPHAADDPPCDECGHGSFERAVVQQRRDAEPSDPVWTCTACGREHVRHSPPCSRCGNTTLEKGQRDYGDLPDAEGPRYRDLASPRYLAVAGVALVCIAALGLAVAGVVSIPGLDGGGHPTVSGVPGHAESAGGVSLSAAESSFVATVNADRADRGARELRRDGDLSALATYANRRLVKRVHADGDPLSMSELRKEFSPSCSVTVYQSSRTGTDVGSLDRYESGEELGERLAALYRVRGFRLDDANGRVGVDLHVAPDGTVYATVATC